MTLKKMTWPNELSELVAKLIQWQRPIVAAAKKRSENQWHDSFSSTFYSFSRKFKLNFKVSALKALKWAAIPRSQLAAIGSTFSPGDGPDIYDCVCRFRLTKFSWITGWREVGCLWLAAAKILRSHRRREEPAARQHSSCTFYWFSAQYGFPATKDQEKLDKSRGCGGTSGGPVRPR